MRGAASTSPCTLARKRRKTCWSYENEGFSGGNLERPQFKKMMKDSQKIAFAAIVVYRLDRISRNIGDFAECAEFDGEHGIMVYNRSLQRPGKANQIRPMEE